MNPKSSLPQRRAMRLRDYDYSQPGAYFLSICAQHRKCLFGTIIDGQMRLNEIGEIVVECWSRIPQHFPSVELGEYVIMPNHIHGIIESNIVGARSPRPIEAEHSTPPTVGARSPHPTEVEQSIYPTVGARSPRPIGAEQSSPTVGARSTRPTRIRLARVRQNRSLFQISIHKAYQPTPQYARDTHLAKKLLRSCHPRRHRFTTNLPIHSG